VTNVSLVNAQTATPSFVPDREGTYVLSLVVNDGVLDSPVDTASVFVNSPPTVDVHPETINLKSNGGSQSVTAVLASRVLSSFAFFTASDGLTVTAQFTLENRYVDRDGNTVVFTVPAQVPSGGYRVVATDTDGDGHPDLYQLTLKFSRALIIAGFTDAGGNLRITQSTPMVSTVIADGVIVGSDTNSVITPP
jgi:hypothetical protein